MVEIIPCLVRKEMLGINGLLTPKMAIPVLVDSEYSGVGVPHGVLGDIWMHLELKGGEICDHWTSIAGERGSAATS
ncbi:hypothetical protein F2Q68_00038220 [Brassica cretica]|uniref:Uncharacterized protein n=1 Tax=Brassica cretica TaxID=69181 RepID=A0A8S9MNU7_BRACR|nr:hypothetical protein F2Q68_00038220 [Brassica cretica]